MHLLVSIFYTCVLLVVLYAIYQNTRTEIDRLFPWTVAKKYRKYTNERDARKERVACMLLGVPSLVVLSTAFWLHLTHFTIWWYGGIGVALWLLVPLRRMVGFVVTRKSATIDGKPPRYSYWENITAYFWRVWQPRARYQRRMPRVLTWLFFTVGMIVLWPLAATASTVTHLYEAKTLNYFVPWWRIYLATPTKTN